MDGIDMGEFVICCSVSTPIDAYDPQCCSNGNEWRLLLEGATTVGLYLISGHYTTLD